MEYFKNFKKFILYFYRDIIVANSGTIILTCILIKYLYPLSPDKDVYLEYMMIISHIFIELVQYSWLKPKLNHQHV
jgi:hypothetical protein